MMFFTLVLLFGSAIAISSQPRKLQDANNPWVARRTVDSGGLCLYEPECYNYWGGCEAGSFCNVTHLPGGQIHSLCLENPGHEGKDGRCYSIRNSNGANNRIGCVEDSDCCNPAAKCGLDRYCHLECDLPDPPTSTPTAPSDAPTEIPTQPTEAPSETPTKAPTAVPTRKPSEMITDAPIVSVPEAAPASKPNKESPAQPDPSVPVPLPHTEAFEFSTSLLFWNTNSLTLGYDHAVEFSRTLATGLNVAVGNVGARQVGSGRINEDGTKEYNVLVLMRVPNANVPDPYKSDYDGFAEFIETYLETQFPEDAPSQYNDNLDKAGLSRESNVEMEVIKRTTRLPTLKPSISIMSQGDGSANGSSPSGDDSGAIIGGVVGALIGTGIVALLGYYVHMQLNGIKENYASKDSEPASNPTSFDNVDVIVTNQGVATTGASSP